MAATTLPYLSLLNVRLTLNTGVWIDLTSIDIDWKAGFDARTAGSSFVEQYVKSRQDSTWKLKGWNSSNMSYGKGVITPYTRVATLTLMDTSATPVSVLDDTYFTLFPVTSFMFGDLSTSFGVKPGDWNATLQANVLG